MTWPCIGTSEAGATGSLKATILCIEFLLIVEEKIRGYND